MNEKDGDEFSDDGVFIESPLGMVEDKFPRYYVVLSTQSVFSKNQQKRLLDAIHEIEKGDLCILEHIKYEDFYVLVSIGVSFDVAPQSIIDDIVIAANGADPFLQFHFFATNTHKPTEKEISEYLASIS